MSFLLSPYFCGIWNRAEVLNLEEWCDLFYFIFNCLIAKMRPWKKYCFLKFLPKFEVNAFSFFECCFHFCCTLKFPIDLLPYRRKLRCCFWRTMCICCIFMLMCHLEIGTSQNIDFFSRSHPGQKT